MQRRGVSVEEHAAEEHAAAQRAADQRAELTSRIDAIWRTEAAKLIAHLTRVSGDLGRGEDLAHDALVAALEQWPSSGIPDNPGAWLMTVGKRRAIDQLRRRVAYEEKHELLKVDARIAHQLEAAGGLDEAEEVIKDEVLRLMFIACHPVLATQARVALTLRLLGGLSTEEIARAFLAKEATIAQRIVRAKRALSTAQVPFEVPAPNEVPARLGSVLEVIYLIFNEGYAATSGEQWTRPALCEEALRLGRQLASLLPGEAEVHGLVGLMELQASRLSARIGPNGEAVLLAEQDRTNWDQVAIASGLAALGRSAACGQSFGPYALQGAIAACHACAAKAEDTDWAQIAALYDELGRLSPSPVVELNRAVAVSMAFGPAAGLEIVEALDNDGALASYHLLPAVRADLLERLGRFAEAAFFFELAGSLAQNQPEQQLLARRAARARQAERLAHS